MKPQKTVLILHPAWTFRNPNCGAARDLISIRKLIEQYCNYKCVVKEWQDSAKVHSTIERSSIVIACHSSLIDAVRSIRKTHPNTRVLVRAGNAEALQKWDRTRAGGAGIKESVARATKALINDIKIGIFADGILSINDWESKNYWRWLVLPHKIFTVPYIPLTTLLPSKGVIKYKSRPMAIISMQSANDSIANSQRLAFQEYAKTLNNIGKGEKMTLLVSRGEESIPLSQPEGCQTVEFDRPETIYSQVRGIATLSGRGYGTKTSVVDAIGAGLWACVHPKILKRMPIELHQACIPIDPAWESDVEAALRTIQNEPKTSAKHGVGTLKRRAIKTLTLALE